MSITHVFSRNVTYKKHKKRKCFRHIEIMIFTTIFLNCVFNTRNEKKVISRYNTHKKFIMTHKKGTGSEAGIGSGTVFFRFFLDTLIRGDRPAVCRRVLTGICLKRFIKIIIIDTRTHSNI